MSSHVQRITLTISGLCFSILPMTGLAELNQTNIFGSSLSLPLMPRVTGLGMAGDQGELWGDVMLPLMGDPNRVWYLDIQAKTAFDSDWFGSIGTGVRRVYNDTSIWGAYVFVDHNNSLDNNGFWFISPGVEELGDTFDFRANGYIPTSSKKQYGKTDWADNLGVYDYVSFQGHEQFDILMTQDEEVGWGADVEMGMKIPGLRASRAYLGGYHFNFADASDITGVAGRVEVPVNRYLGFTVRDSYDNEQHNTFMLGVKLTVGGVNLHPRDPRQAIQERILDPIERNIATLGQGVGEPVQDVLTPVANQSAASVERANIWFFSPTGTETFDGTVNTCTIEDVCINTNFTQDTVDGINALVATSPEINTNLFSTSPSFFLAPGAYSALDEDEPLQLTNDWLFGRSASFIFPEQNAILTGALIINGSNNLLNNIILQNSAEFPQDIGISLNPDSSLTIKKSIVGANPILLTSEAGSELNYSTAIMLQDATLKILDYSQIFAYNANEQAVIGIQANYSPDAQGYQLVIEDSKVSAQGELFLGNTEANHETNVNVTALSLQGAPEVIITDAEIEALATVNGNLFGNNMATGIYANDSTVTLIDTDMNVKAEVTGDNQGFNFAAGIGANSVNSTGEQVFQNNSFIINDSYIDARAFVGGDNLGTNFSAGIGKNAGSGVSDETSSDAFPIFTENTFTLNNSTLNSTASVALNNMGFNAATGIGGNATTNANASIIENTFIIENTSLIWASAIIGASNNSLNFVAGIGDNSNFAGANFLSNAVTLSDSAVTVSATIYSGNTDFNAVTGIGGNTNEGSALTDDNTISLVAGSSITSSTHIVGDNFSSFTSGIGGNTVFGGATFDGNTITLDGSAGQIAITSNSEVDGNNQYANFSTGIGGNSDSFGTASFNFNTITLNNAVVISSVFLGFDNLTESANFSAGIGGNAAGSADSSFTSNEMELTGSVINANAEVAGVNQKAASNFAVGIGANVTGVSSFSTVEFTDNSIILNNTAVNAKAVLDNNNIDGFNFAAGIGSNNLDSDSSFNSNTINVLSDSSLSVTAAIKGENQGLNYAIGLGGNGAVVSLFANMSFNDNSIDINNANLTAIAKVDGDNTNTNSAIGLGTQGGGDDSLNSSFASSQDLNITDSVFDVEALVLGTNKAGNSAVGLRFPDVSAGTVNINGTQITVLANADGNTGGEFAAGIVVRDDTAMTFNLGTTDIKASALTTTFDIGTTFAFGLYSSLNTAGSSVFNINSGTTIAVDAQGGAAAKCFGNATFNDPLGICQ